MGYGYTCESAKRNSKGTVTGGWSRPRLMLETVDHFVRHGTKAYSWKAGRLCGKGQQKQDCGRSTSMPEGILGEPHPPPASRSNNLATSTVSFEIDL